MAGWAAYGGMVALSPSAVFRSAARRFATHIESAAIRLWLSAAAAKLWAMKGNREWELGKWRKGGEAAAAALCHLALLT
jgi:hypothetical protein